MKKNDIVPDMSNLIIVPGIAKKANNGWDNLLEDARREMAQKPPAKDDNGWQNLAEDARRQIGLDPIDQVINDLKKLFAEYKENGPTPDMRGRFDSLVEKARKIIGEEAFSEMEALEKKNRGLGENDNLFGAPGLDMTDR